MGVLPGSRIRVWLMIHLAMDQEPGEKHWFPVEGRHMDFSYTRGMIGFDPPMKVEQEGERERERETER